MDRRTRTSVYAAMAILLVLVVKVGGLGGGSHSYAFLREQGGQPVTFNHCRAIHYQVNPFEAPKDWEKIVHQAFADIQAASGWVFVDAGTTTKRQLVAGSYYPGNALEPLLITWSDTIQESGLSDAWGFASPLSYDFDGHLISLTGYVVMGTQWFQHYPTVSDERVQTVVLEHELGHVLGLGHVEDRSQVMNNGYAGQSHLGKGDIAGLKRLREVPCS